MTYNQSFTDMPRIDLLEVLTTLYIARRSPKSIARAITLDAYIKRIELILYPTT